LERKLAAFRQDFQQKHAEAAKVVFPDLLQFLVALGTEGERSGVVLGAERVNVALEALLMAFLRPSLTKTDALFSSDGALATFSRKIELAHRLGLIDSRFRQALDLVRRLRNDFAHATKVETLEEQRHADRVRALSALISRGNPKTLEGLEIAFRKGAGLGTLPCAYLASVMVLLLKLELVRHHVERPKILLPAKLDYQEQGAD
jgi:hypothetical protein